MGFFKTNGAASCLYLLNYPADLGCLINVLSLYTGIYSLFVLSLSGCNIIVGRLQLLNNC